MKFFIALLMLTITSFTYANEQTAKTIKATSIQGVDFSMDLELVKSILTSNGYQVAHFDQQAKSASFHKEGCRLLIDRSTSSKLIEYSCKAQVPNVEIIQLLDELCEINDDGKLPRKGCAPEAVSSGINFYETFKNLEAYEEYKYSAVIGIGPGRSSVKMTAATEYEMRDSTAKITGQFRGLHKRFKVVNNKQDSVFVQLILRDTNNVADATLCDGQYYLNKTIPKLQPGEVQNTRYIDETILENNERMKAFRTKEKTALELLNVKIINNMGRYICLFDDIKDLSYSPVDRGFEQVEQVLKKFTIQGISLFSSMEKVRSTLANNGFNESAAGVRGGGVKFTKGDVKDEDFCHITHGSNYQDHPSSRTYSSTEKNTLKYHCPSDVDGSLKVANLFKELCAVEHNGALRNNRQGCSQPNYGEPSQIVETFKVRTEDGSKYYSIGIRSHKTAPSTFYYTLTMGSIRQNK